MTIFQNINTWNPVLWFTIIITAVPQKDPYIEGNKHKYSLGEVVELNCTSNASDPVADLFWYINGLPVSIIHFMTSAYIQLGSKVILIPNVLCTIVHCVHAYIFFAKILNLVPSKTKRLMLHTTLMRLHSFEKTPLWHTYCYLKTKAKGNNILGVITCLCSLEFVQSHVRILHCNIW